MEEKMGRMDILAEKKFLKICPYYGQKTREIQTMTSHSINVIPLLYTGSLMCSSYRLYTVSLMCCSRPLFTGSLKSCKSYTLYTGPFVSRFFFRSLNTGFFRSRFPQTFYIQGPSGHIFPGLYKQVPSARVFPGLYIHDPLCRVVAGFYIKGPSGRVFPGLYIQNPLCRVVA